MMIFSNLLMTGVAAAGAERAAEARAWSLFGVVASLLAIFLIVVASIALMRAWRRGVAARDRHEAAQPETDGDAWAEAGRRIGSTGSSQGPSARE